MYLLDTFALICLIGAPDRMLPTARRQLTQSIEPTFFSPINVWEIEIKVKSGKLDRPHVDLIGTATKMGFQELPVSAQHAVVAGQLPLHHKDPFDRMLIAQARCEQLRLVTPDKLLQMYGVQVLLC